jgi:hypothetical protein
MGDLEMRPEMRLAICACLVLGFACSKVDSVAREPNWAELGKVWDVILGRPVSSGSVQYAVLVDPWKINLADEKILAALLSSPTDRLIVHCFAHGETLHPTKSVLFQQARRYRGQADLLGALLSRAHANGKQVFAYVDCLDWTGPDLSKEPGVADVSKEKGVRERHPELAERTR